MNCFPAQELSARHVHQNECRLDMPETRTTAVAIRTDSTKVAVVAHAATDVLSRLGSWASDTAQEFGAVVAALMGPAVFSGYALAAWSLSSNLGWTDTFFFSSGPLSNWLVWLGIAVSVNLAASILRRRTTQGN